MKKLNKELMKLYVIDALDTTFNVLFIIGTIVWSWAFLKHDNFIDTAFYGMVLGFIGCVTVPNRAFWYAKILDKDDKEKFLTPNERKVIMRKARS